MVCATAIGSGGKVGTRVGVKHPTRPATWQGPRGQALQSSRLLLHPRDGRTAYPRLVLPIGVSQTGSCIPGRPVEARAAGLTALGGLCVSYRSRATPSRWPPERPQPSTPSHGLTPRRPFAFGVPSPPAASPTSRQTHAAGSTRADASPWLSDANGHVAPDAGGAGGSRPRLSTAPCACPRGSASPGGCPSPAAAPTMPRTRATPRDAEKQCHVLDGAPQSRELRDPNDPGPCSPRTVLASITTSADSGSSNANLRLLAERLID